MKKLTILILLLAFFSCREDPTQIKKRNLIPKKKLVEVLIEMHLQEALSNDYHLRSFFPSGDSINIYENIFERYEITEDQFEATIASYSKRPDQFLEIYNEVLVKLNYINDTLNYQEPMFSKERSQFSKE